MQTLSLCRKAALGSSNQSVMETFSSLFSPVDMYYAFSLSSRKKIFPRKLTSLLTFVHLHMLTL